MQRAKQASKRKRVTKAAVPALGAAGLTFSLAGGVSASAVPTGDVQYRPSFAPGQVITLSEEELADVSEKVSPAAPSAGTAALVTRFLFEACFARCMAASSDIARRIFVAVILR